VSGVDLGHGDECRGGQHDGQQHDSIAEADVSHERSVDRNAIDLDAAPECAVR
jgi:hypothetical protein